MTEIEILEAQVKELRLKESYDKLIKDFESTKERYLGKCFASKGLKPSCIGKYKNLNNLSLVKINSIYIGERWDYSNEHKVNSFDDYKREMQRNANILVLAEAESIYISKIDDKCSFNIGTKCDVPHRVIGFDQEIPEKTYNNLRKVIHESLECILYSPIKNMKCIDYVDPTSVNILKEKGFDFIEINTDEEYALQNHPFKYFNHLINNDLSKEIIMDMIKEEQKLDSLDQDKMFYGERIRRIGNHKKRIDLLNNIIERMKNNYGKP